MLKEKFLGHIVYESLVLKDVASHDTWIWHNSFKMAGSHNDLIVLDHSPCFKSLCKGIATTFSLMSTIMFIF